MAINQLSNANTFGEQVVSVSGLIAIANNLTDGPQLNCNTLLYLTHADPDICDLLINVITENCSLPPGL